MPSTGMCVLMPFVSTKTRKLKRGRIIPVLTKITEKFYAINLNENRNIEGTL